MQVLKKGGKFVTIANFGDAKSTEDHSFQAFLIKSDSEDLKTHVNQVLAKKNSFFSTRSSESNQGALELDKIHQPKRPNLRVPLAKGE